ncbi:MAG: N-acetylmuramoyl-L-alanine amidase [Opitutus sp.]|nr:N-acetylmuramoyl-L-alanine amidase [Opitutus sp.]
MPSAAHRVLSLALGLAASITAAQAQNAAEAPVRAAPSRPGITPPVLWSALPTRKFGKVDYVSVSDAAGRLSLKLTWLERGRKLTLTGPASRAELEKETRDITVNGLRVFLGDPLFEAGGQLYVSRADFELCLTPLLRPGLGVTIPSALRTIVLDPGHGGKDNGTSINEKTYALEVAHRTKKLLEAGGHRVVLTREDDTFIELKQRPMIANVNQADVFVSIHFNALARDSKTSGIEVYTFAPQFQRSADAWSPARKDDAEDSPSPINRFDHWNVVLAQAVQRRLVFDVKAVDRGKKLMHLGVLRGLACPGVLVECGFLTSEAEARKIATPAYRQQLAEALAAGLRDYSATLDAVRPRSAPAGSPL